MVGTRHETNTFGKEKTSTNNSKKPMVEAKLVIRMHDVKMKVIVLVGKGGGVFRGPPTMEPPKEVKKKKLKKTSDRSSKVPLTLVGLTGKRKYDGNKNSKVNDVHET